MEFIVHNALVPSANFPGEHTTSITTWDLNKNYYIRVLIITDKSQVQGVLLLHTEKPCNLKVYNKLSSVNMRVITALGKKISNN